MSYALQGLVGLIEGMGGTVRCNTAVDQILVENGRAVGVKLPSGERLKADVVVSNADSATTYKNLVPAEARRRWTDKKIEKSRYSMSLFVWYFGLKKRYEHVAHHTIMLGPRYKGLLDDIFTNHTLSDDFSLYLHRPTATDPSLAPEGCDGFYVLSPVPNLVGDIDWAKQAKPYRDAIAKKLSETLLPGLEENLAVEHWITPFDFRDRLSSFRGAAFGIEPILTQSAYFRPPGRDAGSRADGRRLACAFVRAMGQGRRRVST
jgi:phytoene desaturase